MPEQTKTRQYLAPVKLEAVSENSSSVYINTLRRKLRGRWSRFKLGTLTTSVSREMAAMPEIPGQRLTIIPKELKVVIYDPLNDDKDTLEAMSNVWRSASRGVGGGFKPVETEEIVLDDDKLVTLFNELTIHMTGKRTFLEVVSGTFPTAEQIESLPGRELTDFGLPHARTKYKDDVDKHKVLLEAMAEKGIVI